MTFEAKRKNYPFEHNSCAFELARLLKFYPLSKHTNTCFHHCGDHVISGSSLAIHYWQHVHCTKDPPALSLIYSCQSYTGPRMMHLLQKIHPLVNWSHCYVHMKRCWYLLTVSSQLKCHRERRCCLKFSSCFLVDVRIVCVSIYMHAVQFLHTNVLTSCSPVVQHFNTRVSRQRYPTDLNLCAPLDSF